jgi:hypothetical protein
MKGTVPLDAIEAAAVGDYAGILGHLLAKGCARTSGASTIAGCIGGSDKLARAVPLRPRPRRPDRGRPRGAGAGRGAGELPVERSAGGSAIRP